MIGKVNGAIGLVVEAFHSHIHVTFSGLFCSFVCTFSLVHLKTSTHQNKINAEIAQVWKLALQTFFFRFLNM